MRYLVLLFLLLLLFFVVSCRYSEPQRVAAPSPFKWNVCDGAKGSVIIALAISPSPIVLGQNITVSGAIQVNQPFDTSTITSIAITLQKQIFGEWVDIPCIEGLGSCTYDTNLCDALEKNKVQVCSILQPLGLPCQCPFGAGNYKVNGASVEIPNPGVSWATNGDFYAKVVFQGSSAVYACTEAYFSLTSSGTIVFNRIQSA
jgi:ganglioside GM2 activator